MSYQYEMFGPPISATFRSGRPTFSASLLAADPPTWWHGPRDWCRDKMVWVARWIGGRMLEDWLTGGPVFRSRTAPDTGGA